MNEFDHVHLFYTKSFDEESHFAHDLLQHVKVENNSLNLTDLLYKNASAEIEQWMSDLSGSVSIAFMYNKNSDYVFPFFHTPSCKHVPIIQETISGEEETIYEDDDEIIIDEPMDNTEPPFAYFSNHFLRFITKLKENEKVSFINIDLLTCNLNLDVFKNYISEIESTYNIQIRYSIDKTGNPNNDALKDVNWVLESHGVNIRNLYFNETVVQWHGYLDDDTLLSQMSFFIDDISNNYRGTTYKMKADYTVTDDNAFALLGRGDIFDGSGHKFFFNSLQRANGLFRIKSDDDYSSDPVNSYAPLIKNVEIRNASISATNEALLLQQNSKYVRLENCRAIECTINSPFGAVLCGNNAGNSSDGYVHINGCYTIDCTCVIAPSDWTLDESDSDALENIYYEYELNGVDNSNVDTGDPSKLIEYNNNKRISGIVSSVEAHNTNFDIIIENCYNRHIELYAKNSGGIVGGSNVRSGCNSIVRNCFSIGGKIGYDFNHIKKKVYFKNGTYKFINNAETQGIGAIGGSSFNGTIINCFSNDEMRSASGQNGFIVGNSAGNNTNIVNCYSTGDIVGGNSGGITGTSAACDISNCFSLGNISGSGTGGMTGYGTRESASITNCYSTGNIEGFGSGGLCGSTCERVIVRNSFTAGSIIGHQSGGLLGARAACTFSAGSSSAKEVKIYNSYAIGDMNMNSDSHFGGGLLGALSGDATQVPFNHTIQLYNCYYAGNMTGSTTTESGALASRECFALKAYNSYSTDNSLPLIGTVFKGRIDNTNTYYKKADLYFYNCQSGSGNFVFNTNADDISHIQVTLPSDGTTTYTGNAACADNLYSTEIIKSENESHDPPYEPIYKNEASYDSAQSPYDMHPWKSGTYNAWNDRPTLLWQHENLNQPLSSKNKLCNTNSNEHILIDLGSVYNTDRLHNISIYNLSDALGEGIRNIKSVQLLNYKKQVQYIYEHGTSHDGLTDSNSNTVGAVRYYGPAKSTYAGSVPYVSQINASDEALIFYGTTSSLIYKNESVLTLYQPNTSGSFRYILMRTRPDQAPPNLREVQCWVSNVNVCITGNSLNPAVTPTGKFIDLSQNRSDYNQPHQGHFSGNSNFAHPDLAMDNLFSTHSHPVDGAAGEGMSLFIDLGANYELTDLQCLVMYNRLKPYAYRYESVDSVELLNSDYEIVAYYNHDASNNDKTDIDNSTYKEQYLYRGHAYNSIPTSMITNDGESTTQIRDDPTLYLNGVEDGIISYTLTNPSLAAEASIGKVIRTETKFDVTDNGDDTTPSLKITTLRRKIKDCLIAEFLAKENYISGTEWLPNYVMASISTRIYGLSKNGNDVGNSLVFNSEENGLEIPCDTHEASTKYIEINLDNNRAIIPNLSWELWIKINNMDISTNVPLITNRTSSYSDTHRNASIHNPTNGFIGVEGRSGTTPSYIRKIDLYQLQHLIFTYDNTSGKNVYINGKKYYNENNATTTETRHSNRFVFLFTDFKTDANEPEILNQINEGFIYSFRSYNKILNDREVKYLYKEKYKCATVL